MKKLVCLVVVILFLGGCSHHELGALDIITGLEIDVNSITALISDQNENTAVQGTRGTMGQAVASIASMRGGELYFGHIQETTITEEQAKQGLSEVLDYLRRMGAVRLSMPLIVRRGEGVEQKKLDGIEIARTVARSAQKGMCPTIPLYMLLDDISAIGIEGILPVIDKEEVAGAAYFKDERLAGFIPKELVYCLVALRGQPQNPTISTESCEFEADSIKVKLTSKIENGSLVCDISVKADVRAVAWHGGILMEGENRAQAEEQCAQQIKMQMEQLISIVGISRCDFIGIGQMLHRRKPSVWEKVEATWGEMLSQGIFNVEVETTLLDGGRVIEGEKIYE